MKYMKISVELNKGQVKEVENYIKQLQPKGAKITKRDIQQEVNKILSFGLKGGRILEDMNWYAIMENGKKAPEWIVQNS